MRGPPAPKSGNGLAAKPRPGARLARPDRSCSSRLVDPCRKERAVLHRLAPSRKRIAALGLGVFAVLVVVAAGEATTKKPIIILLRGFQPGGEINRTGTLVKLHGAAPQQEIWDIGDRFSFVVT